MPAIDRRGDGRASAERAMRANHGTTADLHHHGARLRRVASTCALVVAAVATSGAPAGTVVGRIAGHFNTSATGAAAYTIPIRFTPEKLRGW